MNKIIELQTPLTKEKIENLKIGDIVELTGTIYTARDAAHKRIKIALEEGKEPPIDFKNQLIFYAGPCPVKPGRTMGSIAPTTSMRMDSYVEMTFQLGMLGMIGKGDRSDYVPEICKKYKGIYFLSIGGASALISNQVKKCDIIAYEDLGAEAIFKLHVEEFPLIVIIDSHGNNLYEIAREKYKKN